MGSDMKALLASVVTALVLAGGGWAAGSFLPVGYQGDASQLTAKCGGLRAEIIARMEYARDIHIGYVGTATRNPDVGKTVGTAAWHRWWAETYRQTILLLKADCQ